MSFIVAIDGPAGSGKGTITKLVGEKLGLVNIDTGATFRCVTLAMLQQNISTNEEEKIKKLLENIKIEFKKENNIQMVLLNGQDVTKKIREKESIGKVVLFVVIAYLISAMFGNSMYYTSPYFFIFLGWLMKDNIRDKYI